MNGRDKAALAMPAPGMARVVRTVVDRTELTTMAPAPDGTKREVQAITDWAFAAACKTVTGFRMHVLGGLPFAGVGLAP